MSFAEVAKVYFLAFYASPESVAPVESIFDVLVTYLGVRRIGVGELDQLAGVVPDKGLVEVDVFVLGTVIFGDSYLA